MNVFFYVIFLTFILDLIFGIVGITVGMLSYKKVYGNEISYKNALKLSSYYFLKGSLSVFSFGQIKLQNIYFDIKSHTIVKD